MLETFAAEWLALREPYDAVARHPLVAAALIAALPPRPRLIDLGAGTGSLLRWLAPQIGGDQAWLLVDADAALLARAFVVMAEYAAARGWSAERGRGGTLLISTPRGRWDIATLTVDLAQAPAGLPLAAADALVCTALCDLVSRPWLEAIAEACARHALPFYAALNVTGQVLFRPPDPLDAVLSRGFRRDQRRDKGFGGPALGPATPALIAALFADRGFTLQRGRSDWVVRGKDARFLRAIIRGHATAARHWQRGAAKRIAAWVEKREKQVGVGRCTLIIGHQDLLALPSPDSA